MLQIKFLDLAKQQKTIEKHLRLNLDKVLSESRFIMGPEVQKLEVQSSSSPWRQLGGALNYE